MQSGHLPKSQVLNRQNLGSSVIDRISHEEEINLDTIFYQQV